MRKPRKGEIPLGFLIASVFWIGVLGWQSAYAPTEKEKQECYEAAKHGSHKAEECKTLWERTTTDPVAFFTFWLVVFTGGLGVSTVLLWIAGEKQIGLARETAASQSRDMQASIKVAQDAAKAAAKTAEVSERALIQADRAWIAIQAEIVGELIFDAENIDTIVKISFKNVGKSPAINVSYAWGMFVDLVDAAADGRKQAESARTLYPALQNFGRILFPGDEFSEQPFLSVSRRDFLKRIEDYNEADKKEGEVPSGICRPALMIFAYYGLPSAGKAGKCRFTTLLVEIRDKKAPFGQFTGEECSFSPDALHLVQSSISGVTT